MRVTQFILSILIAICAATMLVSASITPSPIQGVAVTAFGIMFMLCLVMIRVTFKELREP